MMLQQARFGLVQAAEKAMGLMLKLPDAGRIVTKLQSRSAFSTEWRDQLDAESEMGFTQLQVSLCFLYTRKGSNRGNPQSTIMYRQQNR